MSTSSVGVRVTGLNIHPVKSCRGIAVPESLVTRHGLAHDREWMVVDGEGEFVTQRSLPRMALIETRLTPTALEVRAPGMDLLSIPREAGPPGAVSPRQVTVWGDVTLAHDEGDRAAAWFGRFLEVPPLRLVRWDPRQRRRSDHEWTGGVDAENQFSDAFPFLVISEESLADLNARIGGATPPLPMNRFRPNLVIGGGEAGLEDRITTLRNDAFEFRLVKPSDRCRITTTDQATAAVGVEPLRTLATYRRDSRFRSPVFGQNAILIQGAGRTLRVGMELEAG